MIKDLIKRCIKRPKKDQDMLPGKTVSQDLPLDTQSPWPKFRGNELQNGRSSVKPIVSDAKPWAFQTGKGIFSSPVIDNNGTIYIGSADHYFYALSKQGELKWQFAASEIIDSSALLDDRQRVYFGSGDGHVYCLDRNNGEQIWKFRAHSTKEVKEIFNIKTYNLNWFEGNIAMLKDGTILAPNDNYLVYALDRESGECKTLFFGNEMIWSCPAVNTDTDRIFFGTCFIAAINFFCFKASTGKKIWTSGGLGTVSGSPMLTSKSSNGAVLAGGFDGILRALSQDNGKQLWAFGTRDHIYGSPAQLSCGTIVQASCDGTVYGLDPESGKVIWTFDTPEPIRSSPVVDAEDHVYFGSGEGRLYCINKNGTFRWAYQCIDSDRNDLNGSPALGKKGICIAGENGNIFFIPYDYPLTKEGKKDPKSIIDLDSPLPKDGAHFFCVTPFGKLLKKIPDKIDANEPIILTHFLRKDGRTLLSAIDTKSLKVSFSLKQKARVTVSANRKFITLIPKETWTGPDGGQLEFSIQCRFITKLKRFGLKFFLGKKTHSFSGRLKFKVSSYKSNGNNLDHPPMPYLIPVKIGDPSTVFEISRLSCPNPTMLPSYNQIGFDSLHYLAGIVEGIKDSAVLWVVPGRLEEQTKKTVVDPKLRDVYVICLNYKNGLVTFHNYDGFMISFVGSWDMPFQLYRIASKVNQKTGAIEKTGALNAQVQCDKIKFYGKFLKLMGMSDIKTGLMSISGGVNLDIWEPDQRKELTKESEVSLKIAPEMARASLLNCNLRKTDHVFGILLIHSNTGLPVPVNYARKTQLTTDEQDIVTSVTIDYSEMQLKGKIRGYVMVDTYAIFRTEIQI